MERNPRVMTRAEFEHYLARCRVPICAPSPWRIVACDCKDVNCHGWRIVAVTEHPPTARRELEYVYED